MAEQLWTGDEEVPHNNNQRFNPNAEQPQEQQQNRSYNPNSQSSWLQSLGQGITRQLGQNGNLPAVNFSTHASELLKGENAKRSYPFKFEVISSSGISGSVVVMHTYSPTTTDIIYTVFIIEKTWAKIPPRTHQLGNRTIEVDVVPALYYDDILRQFTEDNLRSLYTSAKVPRIGKFIHVSTLVVPSSYETDIPFQVASMVRAALADFQSVLSKQVTGIGYIDDTFTAENIRNEGYSLRADYLIRPDDTLIGPTGQPILTDFISTVSIYDRNVRQAQNNDIFSMPRPDQCILTALGAYLDFSEGAGLAPRDNYNGYNRPQPILNPMFVITHNSAFPTDGNSPYLENSLLTQLLTLAALMPLLAAGEYRWTQIIEASAGNIPFGDLGYRYNPWLQPGEPFVPRPIEIIQDDLNFNRQGQTTSTSPRTIAEIARAYVSDTPIVALDSDVGTPLSIAKDIIGGATMGSPEEAHILKTLDEFFKGVGRDGLTFSKQWRSMDPRHGSIVVATNTGSLESRTIFPTAYYVDSSGQKRDARVLRYLTMLNMTRGDYNRMDSYSRFMSSGANSPDMLAANRSNLLQSIPHAVITGVTKRHYINVRFIEMIGRWLEASNLNMSAFGLTDNQSGAFRGHGSVASDYMTRVNGAGYVFGNSFNNRYGGSINLHGIGGRNIL